MAQKIMLNKVVGFNEYLFDAYCKRNLSMKQIGQEIGTTPATILYHLRKNGIKTRNAADVIRGMRRTEEQRKRMSVAQKGRVVSVETGRKISLAKKLNKHRSPNWHGGKRTGRHDGYVQIYYPEHPNSTKEGYVMEHRLALEGKIGRLLETGEVAHHINGNRSDNRPENITLMTFKDHSRYHMKERWNKINAQ